MRSSVLMILCGASILVGGATAAQDIPSASTTNTKKQLRTPDPDKWWFEVAPYLWATALKTEVEIGDVSAETEMDFGDILDVLDGAIMLHAEAHKGNWGIFVDLFYSKISDDEDIGPMDGGEIEVEMKETIAELGGFYRFGENKFAFDVLFGGRALFISTDIEIDGASSGSADEDSDQNYFGPLVGGRMMYHFTPRWFTSLRADASGFGLDDHWTWNATGLFGYRFTNLFSLAFGYRYMYLDFEDDDLEIEQTLHGPIIGFGFRFGG